MASRRPNVVCSSSSSSGCSPEGMLNVMRTMPSFSARLSSRETVD